MCLFAMASGYNSPEDQLRELFFSCDKGDCGLTAEGLRQLCSKLRLGEKGEKQLKQKLVHQRNNDASVDEDLIPLTFEEFKEAFVHLLSQQDTVVSVPSIRANEEKLDFVSGGVASFSGPSSMENKKYSSNASAVNKSSKNCDDSQVKTSLSENDKGLNNLHYSGDNEEEYLRSTWQRLGVGHDGYLTMEELATVCHATGMDKVANEVLEQLFSRLDVDGDGRISFEEFVHMFQNGGPTGNNSLTLDESLSLTQDLSGSPLAIGGLKNGEESQCSTTESGFFSTIDEDRTGYASVSRVIGLWESLNISAGAEILRDMGFPSRPRDRLCLQELAQALEEECRLPEDPSVVTPLQTAVMTCLHEAKFLRTSLEAARGERDKLRTDLSEANHRLSLLAQDLDDHSAHMEANAHQQIQDLERHYREQVRELQEAVLRERDSAREQISVATREISTHNSQLQQEEMRLKQAITQLQNDVKRLEGENMEMSEKLQEAEKMLQLMEKQSQEMQQLKEKISEMESCSPREEEYRGLLERLEGLTSENHQLRDNNDELLAQLDAAPHLRGNQSTGGPTNSDLGEPSLDGSCLGDYIDPPMGLMAAVKRRGSTSGGSGDDSTEEDSPRGGKVRRCSKGANVHYVDVGSYDESFFDSSMTTLVKGALTSSRGCTEESSSLDNVMGSQTNNNQNQKQVFASVRANMGSESPRSLDYVAHAKGSSRGINKTPRMQNKEESSLSSDHAQDTSSFQASTPVKKIIKSPVKEKCSRCYETEGRLTMALEELEMAMRREEQERTQRITISNILSNKDEDSSCSNNSVEPDTTTTTTYPNSEISHQQSTKDSNTKDKEVVLEGQCRRLESELAKVRIEVLKLVEEKEKLLLHKQQLQKRHLGEESITLRERCKAMAEKIKKKNKALRSLVKHSPWQQQQQQEIAGNIDSNSYQDKDLLTTAVGDTENPTKLDSITEEAEEEDSKDEFNCLEKQVSFMEKLLNTVADTAEKQKASLEEKCQKLEHSLEMLRVEFDKSEDYWTLKLSEEQDYYEEERRLTDDKFSALERKIREYEELVLQGSNNTSNREDRSEDEDRLSTIDESAMWEKQVTELEEEVQMLQRQMKEIKDESRGLESAWERRLMEERRTSSQERSNLQEQLNQANIQVASVMEELEKLRQDTEQHNNNRVISSNHNNRAQVSASSVEGGLVNGFMSSDGDSLSPGPMEQDTHQSGEETILSSFRNQLRQCQSRVHYLETALRQHHAHAHHILTVTREQHAAEVQNLEGMMAATQQMLGQHIAKYKDQLSKASRSDTLVRELYLENAQLMRALQITESRQKSAEENTRRIQMAHLGHSSIS